MADLEDTKKVESLKGADQIESRETAERFRQDLETDAAKQPQTTESKTSDIPSLPKLEITNDRETLDPQAAKPADKNGEQNNREFMSWWPFGEKYPKETTDKDGNKVTDYGKGHTKIERKDGTSTERWVNNDGSYREEHKGPSPENNFKVTGDGKGNKTTDWGNGHIKVDKADGTGYERSPGSDGNYTERHFGPKPSDNYTVAGDKDGNKVTDYGNGHTRIEKKDGTGHDRYQYQDGTSFEQHFGPEPRDNYTVSSDLDGTKKYDLGNGHTRVEKKDGTGYDRFQYDDGTSLEKHFGPKKEDNYTVSTDTNGTKKTDWGDGHIKVENKDGTGYERVNNPDGTTTEKHFGPNKDNNYTVTFDKDGNKIEHRLTKEQEDAAKPRRGEGPYQVAKRLLGKDATHKEIMALVRALQKEYGDKNPNDKNMRGLKVGTPLLNNENLARVLNNIQDSKVRSKLAETLKVSK